MPLIDCYQIFGLAVASIMGSGMLDAQGLTTVSTVSTDTIDNNKSVGEQMMGAAAAISHDAACARAFKWVTYVFLPTLILTLCDDYFMLTLMPVC